MKMMMTMMSSTIHKTLFILFNARSNVCLQFAVGLFKPISNKTHIHSKPSRKTKLSIFNNDGSLDAEYNIYRITVCFFFVWCELATVRYVYNIFGFSLCVCFTLVNLAENHSNFFSALILLQFI